jgi:replicative DNA helicase
MKKVSTESLLVSTLINTGDPTAASSHGILPDHLIGYRDEYVWILDYHARYGKMPTEQMVRVQFPAFPFSTDEIDPAWPANEVYQTFTHREALKAVVKAGQLLAEDQTQEAVAVMQSVHYSDTTVKPRSLVFDTDYFDDYESKEDHRVHMPWSTLDNHTNGIGPGELWYWAARPQQGKSSFLIDAASYAAYKGARVMMVSLEMTRRQCQVRFHASMGHRLGWSTKIDAVKMLRREYDRRRYGQLTEEIQANMPGHFDIHDLSDGFASPSTVMRYASEYDLILVDYVGLMRSDSGQRGIDDWRVAATISNALKEVAMSKKCRILAAAQINRDGESSGWRPPKLVNLAQSDALGQDGDVVITMKRYGRDAEILSIEKNRHGPASKYFYTRYLPNLGDLSEVNHDEADDLRDNAPFEGE